jgi:hypothetical protein
MFIFEGVATFPHSLVLSSFYTTDHTVDPDNSQLTGIHMCNDNNTANHKLFLCILFKLLYTLLAVVDL